MAFLVSALKAAHIPPSQRLHSHKPGQWPGKRTATPPRPFQHLPSTFPVAPGSKSYSCQHTTASHLVAASSSAPPSHPSAAPAPLACCCTAPCSPPLVCGRHVLDGLQGVPLFQMLLVLLDHVQVDVEALERVPGAREWGHGVKQQPLCFQNDPGSLLERVTPKPAIVSRAACVEPGAEPRRWYAPSMATELRQTMQMAMPWQRGWWPVHGTCSRQLHTS